jgi:hypothetical protein
MYYIEIIYILPLYSHYDESYTQISGSKTDNTSLNQLYGFNVNYIE